MLLSYIIVRFLSTQVSLLEGEIVDQVSLPEGDTLDHVSLVVVSIKRSLQVSLFDLKDSPAMLNCEKATSEKEEAESSVVSVVPITGATKEVHVSLRVGDISK